LFYSQITITAAAREGARVSALGRPGSVPGVVATAAVPLSGVSGAVTVGCPATVNGDVSTTVVASYTFHFITPVGAIARLFTGGSTVGGDIAMTGKGVMRCFG
jgi:hypothetical protein